MELGRSRQKRGYLTTAAIRVYLERVSKRNQKETKKLCKKSLKQGSDNVTVMRTCWESAYCVLLANDVSLINDSSEAASATVCLTLLLPVLWSAMNLTVCWCTRGECVFVSLCIEWLIAFLFITVLFKGVATCGVLWPGTSSAFNRKDELLLRDSWRDVC